ncbi:MAG: serine/threonine protein kinase [Proteobacteria bacterium]|nr:serine/threonine protein kinase [Pseudomonadota bacterium]
MTEDLIGKEILGQFRILERIGRGGMGEVYKAAQPAMDRLVAIKILHQKLASRPDILSRFRREARAMSRLTHPNTIRVFLYGQLEDTGQLYIAMEYLEGDDLARLTRRDGPMEPHRAARIMVQVLSALEEAHGVGVVHRDLKPENIFLTTQGGIADTPKVLDFGLAKIKEDKLRPGSMVLTREGMVFGTPEFMSPEQARGETLDARSDIYSLGIIFFELLTAKLPFPQSKPMEYIAHHIKTPPMTMSQVRPELGIPNELELIIGRAIEKKREDRYASAAEFAQALEAFLANAGASTSASTTNATPPAASGHASAPSVPAAAPNPTNVPAARPAASPGKGLVIGLLVLIAALLGVVIWLLLSATPPAAPAPHAAPEAPAAASSPSPTPPVAVPQP